MTTPPLSPAAQAVFDAFAAEARPEPHHQREAIAAAIRALVAATLPEEICGMKFLYVPEILAIAAELDGVVPQPTPTETTND
jgi:hypothetical protein